MASRKEQKEQARQARLAKEQELADKAQRTRRMQLFGGAILLAVAVIVVAIIVSSGGSGSKTTGLAKTGKAQSKLVQSVDTLLNGIPQHGSVLGDPNAKITMTYFGDLECPICRDFTLNVFPQFVQNEVRSGKVKVDYKSSCTATCNNPTWGTQQAAYNHFGRQQAAALAAGMQNKFWYYAELFYHQQGKEGTGYVTDSFLQGIAKQIPGLNYSKWSKDLGDPSLLSQVQADETLSQKEAPNGTPTLILEGPKGQLPVTGTCTVVSSIGAEGFPCYPALSAAVKTVS